MHLQYEDKKETERWLSLVHVCRRWRRLVLGSPGRLNLRLYCTHETRAKDTLNVWPVLPLVIVGYTMTLSGTNNIIATLGQSNRVCKVLLVNLAGGKLEEVLATMQVPFPELTDLRLFSYGETLSVIPDSFLDGSAPRLRKLELRGIPFPRLPNLLLSATSLVSLRLLKIPHSGYISPEAIVALLSALSSLRTLYIGFQSPRSHPDRQTRRPPPSKRSVIPTLTSLSFNGVIEYLEDLVTRIDTPQLDRMDVTLFNQIDFDSPRLAQFINCTPKLRTREGHVQFDDYRARVALLLPKSRILEIAISCREPDWQLSSIEQICNSSLHPLSTVEDLYIEHRYRQLVWKDDAIENGLWLQLLLPFTAVKNLYLSKGFAPGIVAAVQKPVGGTIVEVLPGLQNVFVEGLDPSVPFQEYIGQFITARQLSSRPVAISVWDRKSGLDAWERVEWRARSEREGA
jgi:hypothetical protein